jgi:hypothetical protein
VQQLEARALKLAASRCDSICVLDLELDRCLGDHPVGGPGGRRPDAGRCAGYVPEIIAAAGSVKLAPVFLV